MHILVCSGIFHPEAGGPATYLYHLMPHILERGHTVEVIAFGDDPTKGYPYPVTRIPRRGFLRRHAAYYRAVQKALPKADMLFINTLSLPIPWVQKRHKKPMLMKVVGDYAWERSVNRGLIPPTEDIDDFQQAQYGPLISWFKWARAREVQRVDYLITPSHYLRNMVIGWGAPPDKVKIIYNAFEAPPLSSPAPTRQALGLPDGPLLLMVGRLVAWKGLDMLLEALADLPHIQLAIVGDGPTRAMLEAQSAALGLAERVYFLGKIPQARVADYYRVADYKILYSGYEGLSHVLLEALSLGTPVIASDKGGNPEVVIHGQNGFLVPYPNVPALRDALQGAFEGDTPQHLKAGATLDWERFAWAGLVEETLKTLENVAQRNTP